MAARLGAPGHGTGDALPLRSRPCFSQPGKKRRLRMKDLMPGPSRPQNKIFSGRSDRCGSDQSLPRVDPAPLQWPVQSPSIPWDGFSLQSCFRKQRQSLRFYQTFLFIVSPVTFFLCSLDSITQGFNANFMDLKHRQDAAGVAGAQLETR